jgi:putative Mg2+ transporter-C (MgtC) family protein
VTLAWTEVALRLVTATVLASLVGPDREGRETSAGLRTHALVGMSACLLMIVSAFGFADILGTPHVTLDPSRIAAQIVSGIGFLGAGAIIARGSLVRGLTMAASVWTVVAVGLTVGGGLYTAAFFATGISLVLFVVLRPLERRLDRHWRKQGVTAVYDPKTVPMDELLSALRNVHLHVLEVRIDKTVDRGSNQIEITLEERRETALHGALQALTGISGVQSVTTG